MIESKHLSRLEVDKLIAGELEDQAVIEHLHRCASCSERAERLRSRYAHYQKTCPVDWSTIAQQAAARRRRWRYVSVGLPVLGAAAALLLVALSASIGTDVVHPTAEPETLVKGGSILELRLLKGERAVPIDGPLRPGDRLALRATTQRPFLLVCSVEATGKVSVLLANRETRGSIRIPTGRARRLRRGIILDDYIGTERIIAFLSDSQLSAHRVRSAIEVGLAGLDAKQRKVLDVGELDLPAAEQFSWLIKKVPR